MILTSSKKNKNRSLCFILNTKNGMVTEIKGGLFNVGMCLYAGGMNQSRGK